MLKTTPAGNPPSAVPLASKSEEVPNFMRLAKLLHTRTKNKFLVVLDIHGVLLERAHRMDRACKLARSHRKPWRNISGHSIWLRPYLTCFLSMLMTRFRIGVWSSATQKTIKPLLSALSASLQLPKRFDQNIEFLWMSDQCREDPTVPHGSLKYMPDVWQAGFATEMDSLILDDSPSKLRYAPNSAAIISEYSVEKLGDAYNKDDSLLWMLLYIQYLAEKQETYESLSSARQTVISFEDFVTIGRSQARAIAGAVRTKRRKSLAFIFLDAAARHKLDSTSSSVDSETKEDIVKAEPRLTKVG